MMLRVLLLLLCSALCSCGAWNDTLETLNKASDSLAKASDTVAKVQATVGQVMELIAKAQTAITENKAAIDTNKDDKISLEELLLYLVGGGTVAGGAGKLLGLSRAVAKLEKSDDELWEATHAPRTPGS